MLQGNLHEWEKIEEKTIVPGYRARFMHSANMTLALWDIDAGALLPEHAHPHEQVTYLLEGKFDLTINGITHAMKAGGVAIIPSDAKHSGKALAPCRILDVFYPLREDYLPDKLQTALQNTRQS